MNALRALRTVVLTGLCLTLTLPALAQGQTQEDMRLSGVLSYYNGVGIAPYQMIVPSPGGPVIDVYCVDPHTFAHTNQYTAWVSPILTGMLGHTRLGEEGYVTYWQTAWLATQVASATTTTQQAAIQGAMWVVGGGVDAWTLLGRTPPPGLHDWVAAAQANYAQLNPGDWVVLTAPTGSAAQQEFIAPAASVVPEPGTWLMLVTGLVGILGFAAMRGRLV